MQKEPSCPKCQSLYTYADGSLWICPTCFYEWSQSESVSPTQNEAVPEDNSVRDAFGQILSDGDSVTVLKELKIKGASASIKAGTKVRNIRLVDGGDGHDISCKVDGIGSIHLKSEFVKKA